MSAIGLKSTRSGMATSWSRCACAGIETQPDVEVFGAIEVFSDTSWTLSGIVLTTNTDTLIQGDPAVGLLAHAAALLQSDDLLLALRLRVAINQPDGRHNPLEFKGAV